MVHIDLRGRLSARINPQVCPSFDDAQQLVNQALADAGIDDWTVVVSQPATDQQPCPWLAFDSAARRIMLVPIDRTGPQPARCAATKSREQSLRIAR